MLASHTAIIIHLHQMLQLQHKLQQHDLEKNFGPVPRTFRCVSELPSNYIFFMIMIFKPEHYANIRSMIVFSSVAHFKAVI